MQSGQGEARFFFHLESFLVNILDVRIVCLGYRIGGQLAVVYGFGGIMIMFAKTQTRKTAIQLIISCALR